MMDIIGGFLGLAVAFIILVVMVLYYIIDTKYFVASTNRNLIIMFIIIVCVVWYGLVLLYTPNKLMGWATSADIPPNTLVIDLIFDEPMVGSKGAIYIFAVTKAMTVKKNIWKQLSYKNIFFYNKFNTPRLYKIDYTQESHADLYRKWEESRKKHYLLMFNRKNKNGEDENRSGKVVTNPLLQDLFEVVNPSEIMTKD